MVIKTNWLIRACFVVLTALLLGEPLLRSWLQYQTWANDPAAKYLLPPHQPWSYFVRYVFFHFWLWRLIGIFLATIVFSAAQRFIVRPSQGFRMNRAEAFFVAFGIALSGWPYLLVYLVTLLLLYILILAAFEIRFRVFSRKISRDFVEGEPREARFPIALPATLALLIIPFANTLIALLGLTVLRVTNLSV